MIYLTTQFQALFRDIQPPKYSKTDYFGPLQPAQNRNVHSTPSCNSNSKSIHNSCQTSSWISNLLLHRIFHLIYPRVLAPGREGTVELRLLRQCVCGLQSATVSSPKSGMIRCPATRCDVLDPAICACICVLNAGK